MSLWQSRGIFGPDAGGLVGERRSSRTAASKRVTGERAMRHSAVWAARRLRADLISQLPVSVKRGVIVDGRKIPVDVSLPQVLVQPMSFGHGQHVPFSEWLYSSQMDLDGFGNALGYIESFDGFGLPAQIRLLPAENAGVKVKNGQIEHYKVGTDTFDPRVIWHERQYTIPGIPWGLSPIAHAAMSISTYLSAQDFAVDWFGNNITPASWFKNSEKTVAPSQATAIKNRFHDSVVTGDVLVTGKDWEFQTIGAKASESQFLEAMDASVTDIARFLGVPGDMIDAPATGEHITYANVTQRNLQLLVMNMGPAISRRETKFSLGLVPQPRWVVLDETAILRMDPETAVKVDGAMIVQRTRTPNEVRERRGEMPLTQAQIDEFTALFPAPIKPLPSTLEAT